MLNAYFDNHTITKPSPKAVETMLPYLKIRWGNPLAPHYFGQELISVIEKSMGVLYNILGATEEDLLILTSSGAEAVNHVVSAVYLDVTRENGKNHFITSNVDEAPTILSMSRLENLGCTNTLIPINQNGCVTVESIAAAITPQTALVSLAWANGMTGVINPVEEIGKLCRDKGILFHLDVSYGIDKLVLNLEDIQPDFISFEGSLQHAPPGVGVLLLRQGIELSPLIIGGAEQGGLRGGTFNTPGLIGLACAMQEALEQRDAISLEMARLRYTFECRIKQVVPDAIIFYESSAKLPNCSVIGFPCVNNEALLYALNRNGVFASFGGGFHQQLSYILTASGIDEITANTALHFSLSRYTTDEEVEHAVEIILQAVKSLRKVSAQLFRSS